MSPRTRRGLGRKGGLKSRRGFAAMSSEQRRRIAAKGGRSHGSRYSGRRLR